MRKFFAAVLAAGFIVIGSLAVTSPASAATSYTRVTTACSTWRQEAKTAVYYRTCAAVTKTTYPKSSNVILLSSRVEVKNVGAATRYVKSHEGLVDLRNRSIQAQATTAGYFPIPKGGRVYSFLVTKRLTALLPNGTARHGNLNAYGWIYVRGVSGPAGTVAQANLAY